MSDEEWSDFIDAMYPDDASEYDVLEDDVDDFEEAVANCHKGPSGYCGAAGSEYCDFECPFRDEDLDDEEADAGDA